MQPKLIVTISKTVQGDVDYLHVISNDQDAVINIVLIAGEIEIKDFRKSTRNKR